MARRTHAPLSVRFDPEVRSWLQAEAGRRSRLTGVPVGPSSIVRAIVESVARGSQRERESIAAFRKRWKVAALGLTPAFFERLRDRTPEPEIRL